MTQTAMAEVQKRWVPFTAATLTDRPRAHGQPASPPSQEILPVDHEAETAVQVLSGTAAHRHAVQEDLEVLHDLGDRGVDAQIKDEGPVVQVNGKSQRLRRIVDPVVNVEGLGNLVTDPGPMDVGLVGEDQRRTLR